MAGVDFKAERELCVLVRTCRQRILEVVKLRVFLWIAVAYLLKDSPGAPVVPPLS